MRNGLPTFIVATVGISSIKTVTKDGKQADKLLFVTALPAARPGRWLRLRMVATLYAVATYSENWAN
jgi:hypothetical protein